MILIIDWIIDELTTKLSSKKVTNLVTTNLTN